MDTPTVTDKLRQKYTALPPDVKRMLIMRFVVIFDQSEEKLNNYVLQQNPCDALIYGWLVENIVKAYETTNNLLPPVIVTVNPQP